MIIPTHRTCLVDSMIDTVANSLLRESCIYSPTAAESDEVRRLAEIIIQETVDRLASPRDLSIGARDALADVTDLVAIDPETASVDQIREVAIALRGLLNLRDPRGVDGR